MICGEEEEEEKSFPDLVDPVPVDRGRRALQLVDKLHDQPVPGVGEDGRGRVEAVDEHDVDLLTVGGGLAPRRDELVAAGHRVGVAVDLLARVRVGRRRQRAARDRAGEGGLARLVVGLFLAVVEL